MAMTSTLMRSSFSLRERSKKVLVRLSLGLALAGGLAPEFVLAQDRQAKLESWTDSTGQRTIEAEFVRLDGVQLVLRKADGKEVALPLSKLDDKSRLRARSIAKAKGTGSPTGSDTTTAPAAGAATSTAGLKPVVQFPSSPSAQEFFDIIIKELNDENALVLWDALPASKQAHVQEIQKLAATKIEQRTLDQIKKFRAELLKTFRDKKQFFLNSTAIPIPPAQKPLVEKLYDPVVNLVEAYIPEDILNASYLESTATRELVGKYITNLAAKAKLVGDALPDSLPFKANMEMKLDGVKLESVSTTEATVTFLVKNPQPGMNNPTPTKFVLSEGRWLPADMVANWDTAVTQAKAGLATVDPKQLHQQVGQAMFTAFATLGTISSAETQQQFDENIEQLKGMIMPLLMGGAPMGGGPR